MSDKAKKQAITIVTWHKVVIRPATEDEISYYLENDLEITEIFDCKMPEDGQEILIATKWGTDIDVCSNYDYIGLEKRGDWDGVYAWAEIQKYNEDGEDEQM